jgi:Tfp pilus assembly protein PilN
MSTKLKNLTSYFKKNEILAIELGDDALRAVVVKKEDGKVLVLSAAEVANEPQSTLDNLVTEQALDSPQIDGLLGKLATYPRRTVLVTPEVKFLTAELPIPPGAKLSSNKLQEAVRWEAQPYLDFSPSEGLFGYRLLKGKKGATNTTPVLISAISREDYRRLEEICHRCGLALQAVYAKDSAFAYSVDRFLKEKTKGIILNLEQDSIAGAFIDSGNPLTFQTAPLDAVEKLISDLAPGIGEIDEVVIAGSQKEHIKDIIDKLRRNFKFPVGLWKLPDDTYYSQAENLPEIGPQFATCIGAAWQELEITSKGELGIDDRVPLVTHLKTRIHTLPLVIVGLVALSLLAHYTFMKTSSWRYSSRIEELEGVRVKFEGNLSELERLESEISDTYEEKRHIEKVLPDRSHRILNLFDGIINQIPDDVILNRIVQQDDNTFLLEGSGISASSITAFAGELNQLEGTREARLESLISSRGVGFPGAGLFLYQFQVRVILK